MKPLVLISPWFGPWPAWINFFVESCKWNPDVEWLIPTDQSPPENSAPNVRFQHSTFEDYKAKAGKVLRADLSRMVEYKLCDLKPCFGLMHQEDIEQYLAFGFCDIDVIYGDIRSIYTDKLLSEYDAISTHEERISGHFAVFRNTERMRNAFREVRKWRGILQDPVHRGLDEGRFTGVFRPRMRNLIGRLYRPKSLFVERFTTPGHPKTYPNGEPIPDRWIWYRGRLKNAQATEGLVYLHMMFWQSSRWRKTGDPAPWSLLPSIVKCDWREAAERGFSISPQGIELLGG